MLILDHIFVVSGVGVALQKESLILIKRKQENQDIISKKNFKKVPQYLLNNFVLKVLVKIVPRFVRGLIGR